jgi:hypothetical protein
MTRESPPKESDVRHRKLLQDWSTVHSQITFLLRRYVYHPTISTPLQETVTELDNFFVVLTDYSYIIGIANQIDAVSDQLWPRLIDLSRRDNFHQLLSDLAPRFQNYYRILQSWPKANPRDFDQLQAFWEQFQTTYQVLAEENHDISLFSAGLEYAIGGVTSFVDRINESPENFPGFHSLPADVLNLTDILTLMEKFQMLHNFIIEMSGELVLDLYQFLSGIAETFKKKQPEVRKGTAYYRTLKGKLQEALAELADEE